MPLGVWRDIIGNSDVVRALWLQIVQWVEINSDSKVINICVIIRCGRVVTDNIAYPKFRKLIIMVKNPKLFWIKNLHR